MNFATTFYLAAQAPPRLSGAVLLLVFFSLWLAHLQRPRSDDATGVIALDWQKAVLTVCLVGLLALFQAIWLPYENRIVTVVHLLVYLVLFMSRDRQQSYEVAPWAIVLTTGVSVLLLLGYLIPAVRDFAYVEKISGFRFQSYLPEPAAAAFVLIFNLHLLWLRGLNQPWARPLLAANLVCLAATFSGSGLALLALLIATHLRHNFSLRRALLFALLLVALLLGLRLLFPEAFNQMVITRVTAILGSQADNSTFLRFVVPWLFIRDLVQDDLHFWLGTGIGGMVDFIESNHHRLWYLVDFQGQTLTSLNNGYAVVMSLLGIPLGLTLIVWAIWLIWRSPAPPTSKVLTLAYPFFSGFIIHPFFWLLLALGLTTLWPVRPNGQPGGPKATATS